MAKFYLENATSDGSDIKRIMANVRYLDTDYILIFQFTPLCFVLYNLRMVNSSVRSTSK